MSAIIRKIMGRKTITTGPVENVIPVSDPWADHPMHCKCYFHR